MSKPAGLIAVLIFLFLPSQLFAVEIFSLTYYPNKQKTAFPVINLQRGDRLTIEFDIQAREMPMLNIIFQFADRSGTPTTNAFLANRGGNTANNLYLESLPVTAQEDVSYHFKGAYPDKRGEVTFPFEGKWTFRIVDTFDESYVLAEGTFYVVGRGVRVQTVTENEILRDKAYAAPGLARARRISASFTLPDTLFVNYLMGVEIVKNWKMKDSYYIDRYTNTSKQYVNWNGNNTFEFVQRNLMPGNEYRRLNLTNTNRYSGREVRHRFRGFDQSRFYDYGGRDYNGGFQLMDPFNPYATYMWVEFSLLPPDDLQGSVYLTGAFNDWQVLPDYKMFEEKGKYYLDVFLKRGIYDYQYVLVNEDRAGNLLEDWVTLEGNYFETNNEYHIFVYYQSQEYAGYDRIIGYARILTR